MKPNKPPILWTFWHPHQKLWNYLLIGHLRNIVPVSSFNRIIVKFVIFLDTLLLFFRVLLRRIRLLGLGKKFFSVGNKYNNNILYFDLGTHSEGAELGIMINRILPRVCSGFEAYGFEASKPSFDKVKNKYANKNNVHLYNKAVCYEIPESGKTILYHSPGGLGNSIYRENISYEEVESVRLSEWFREKNLLCSDSICLLRMNIEGAECDVIKDLIESGFDKQIDGFYGMWDDLSKIDLQADKKFRKLLFENKIDNITFNGRDLRYPYRLSCIELDINTSIQASINKRKNSNQL